MLGFFLGCLSSAVTGLMLWFLLPRGVVLKKSTRLVDWKGQPTPDTWTLTNDSAETIQLTSVTLFEPGGPARGTPLAALGVEGTAEM